SPTEGKWAGYVFVEQQRGDEFSAIKIPDMRAGILRQIAANPKEAMLRYGQELGYCGHCGRVLTNDESREAGIGPICRARWAFAGEES
ncbi:MAG: DUF6011 domain-containing protein, partial [Kiritimatiellae bacterium]|nr:DUF6011 domain-containing protein [Kiritimatiellia bacterium]